jgi:hypothetical protein
MPSFSDRYTRRAESCAVELSRTVWVTPSRPAEACGVAVTPPPLVYVTPHATTPEPAPLPVPEPLSLQNARFVLRCEDLEGAGPYGTDIVVLPASVGRSFFWTDVPTITASQLAFISQLTDTDLQNIIGGSPVGPIARLTDIQAAFTETSLDTLKAAIDAEVYASTVSTIKCVWRSSQQTESCTGAGYMLDTQTAAGDLAGVRNPIVLLEGFAESANSQSEADGIAKSEARSRLRCLYGNAAQTVACADIGYADPIPTDDPTSPPVAVDGRYRVGTVLVSAGLYFSTTSQADADARARAAGAAMLSCFYVNAGLTLNCKDAYGIDGAYVQAVNYADKLRGNPITAGPGNFTADEPGSTQATADALAELALMSFLQCTFKNVAMSVACPELTTNGVTYPAAGTEVINVAAGEYEGTSQVEADSLALSSALLQLDCQYCNAFIPPACYPPSYNPAPGKAIPLADVGPDWSPDVILGLEAGTICQPTPGDAQILAQAVALQPVPVTQLVTGCTYVNDEMWFSCLSQLPGAPALPRGGYFAPTYVNAALPDQFAGLAQDEQLSPFSTPSPIDVSPYIVLPAGSQVINSRDVPAGMDPKVYANSVAKLYGMALMNCFFATPVMELNCESAFEPSPFVQNDVAQLDGQKVSVALAAGAGTSYVSFAAAYADAKLVAQGVLNCYYESPTMQVRCWSQQTTVPGSLPDVQSSANDVWVYGDGTVRLTTDTDGNTTYSDIVLLPAQLGSIGTPLLMVRGSERSLVSKAAARQRALADAVSILDCTSQALVALLPVCSDKMLVKCGALIEVNAASPYREGTNTQTPTGWFYKDGVLNAGDGHNYIMSQGGVKTNPWKQYDLGCSTDPIGGCTGTGLALPVCFEQGRDKNEANTRAYMAGRAMLTCTGSPNTPPDIPGASGGGGDGNPSQGAPDGCPLFVYQVQDADGKPIPGKFGVTAGTINGSDVLQNSVGGVPIVDAPPFRISLNNGYIYCGIKYTLTFVEGYLTYALPNPVGFVAAAGALPAEDTNAGNFVVPFAQITNGELVSSVRCGDLRVIVRDANLPTGDAAVIGVVKS